MKYIIKLIGKIFTGLFGTIGTVVKLIFDKELSIMAKLDAVIDFIILSSSFGYAGFLYIRFCKNAGYDNTIERATNNLVHEYCGNLWFFFLILLFVFGLLWNLINPNKYSKQGKRLRIKMIFVAVLWAFVLIPGLLFLLENAVLILKTVITVAIGIIIVYIFIFMGVISEGDGGGSSKTPSIKIGGSTGGKTGEKSSNESQKDLINQREFPIRFSTPIWRDKGGYGWGTPSDDCIYYKNNSGNKDFICTVKEFEDGKVAIIQNGNRVVNIKGCAMPKC